MSSSTFVGNSDGLVTGLCPAPPPPPPPPPVPGQVPAMRINTAEAPAIKRPQSVSNDGYEPPAAIQNAMLTKDKKPFTYTPGMGGKLDLSQIRSPRMARRVAKNANDEGIEGPPKSALEPKPTPALNPGANLFVQPQVAVPVFPTNVPPQPSANRTPPTPPINRIPSIVSEKQPEPAKNVIKPDAKVTQIQVTSSQPSSPESPNTPTQITLTKAPTPWLQNKNKPQEELPEWAKRSSKQSSSPESPISAPVYTPVQQTQQPQWQPVQQKQQPMQQRSQSQQFQYQQEPQVYNQQPQLQQYNQQQQKRAYTSPTAAQPASPQERVVPIRIEDRPSVFDVKHEPGHHQFKQPPSTHHQQRWGQSPNHNQIQVQHQASIPQAQQSAGGSYIIPIMVEGSEKKSASGTGPNVYSQPTVRNNTMENQTTKVIQRGPAAVQQSEPGPVQSRSFRVLQKITDTDVPNDVDTEQIRKLQLTEDDRILMNKFKEQVDSDTYLHQEEDPRYRGAAIPSRAFRFLQTMTDSGETPVAPASSRGQNAINKKQNRNSKSFEESQANLPPSEQQVQEPKKYMGSAIPSRSFRILQAMTAPESVATQENHQADYTCQTENNVPGNQQGVFLPPCSPPFWNPEGAWWGYYPLPYQNLPNNDPQQTFDHYPYQPDGTAYIYYPIYNQNYAGYTQYNPLNGDKNAYTNVYPQYIIPSSVQSNENHFNPNYGQSNNCVMIPNNDPGSKLPDNRVQGHEGKVASETCNLNPLPQWTSNVSRTTSSNSNKDSDCTTAMNITDEEEIPETVVTPRIVEGSVLNSEDEKKACPSGGLNVNVPNYSYIDSSDSSDSTDSESNSDNESIIESSKISSSSTSTSDSSSSDSDDSDSYLAYSTGLNPHGRYEDNERNGAGTCSSKGTCDDRLETESSSVNNNSTDCESDSEEQIEQQVENSKTDTTFPHQLSVIYEDVEHADSESPRPQDNKDVRKWNKTPFEATDDPPDEADTTTVSVSLPLRFKFSVSENNEDVTTVIVGDSTIKPERSCNKDDGRWPKEHRGANEKINVPANYQVNNDTSVNFTLKKERLENKRIAKSLASEKVLEEVVESKEEKGEDALIPHVNFTLRKNPSRMNNINCEETVETEFTIRHKKSSSRKENAKVEKDQEDCSVSTNTSTHSSNSSVITVSKGESSTVVSIDDANYADKSDEIDFQTHDFNKNVVKPEVVVSECNWGGDSKKVCSKNASSTIERELSEKDQIHVENDSNISSKHRNDDDRGTDVKDKLGNEAKHLLSVQNSREETDDEDSGVTSDMSRMISEVDTDSECTSSRNMRKYQRTQTHSRLFKLLNDDSVLPGGNERNNDSSSRREYLSLPLKTNGFNYDENYCSNYSSGLTSPEYSPVCEQSWRRLHDGESNGSAVGESRVDHNGDVPRHGHPLSRQERVSCKEDPYYQAWKTSKSPGPCEHDVLPSLAFKILENRRPFWAYKVNVLCPRIKSTKSVPQTLQTNKTTDSTVHPNPSSYVNLRTDHC